MVEMARPFKRVAQMDSLASEYVSSFELLSDMEADEGLDTVAWSLGIDPPDEYLTRHWRPQRYEAHLSNLESIYTRIPARFPPLYEHLIVNYRWAEIDLQTYTLLANPPGADLSGLLSQIFKDQGLWTSLLPKGYIQFAKGPDIDYDPVCFDLSSRKKNRDMRIVKIDHEEILCNYRVKVVAELAKSFEELVRGTIALAKARPSGVQPDL